MLPRDRRQQSFVARHWVFAGVQQQKRTRSVGALCVTMIISAVVLVSAERILRVIGNRLVVAVERLMGLVLVSVAIEMMLRGAKTFALQLMHN